MTFFLFVTGITAITSCGNKNYSVDVTDGTVKVKMKCPTNGMVRNEIVYDGFKYDDVEKDVFDKIRSRNYNEDYAVIVTMIYKDSYGNYYDGTPVTVSHLNGADVKRYNSYSYFSGSTHISDAFPWNLTY